MRRKGAPATHADSRRGILLAPAGSQRRGQGRPNKSPARGTGLKLHLAEGASDAHGKPTDRILESVAQRRGDSQRPNKITPPVAARQH